MADEVFDTCLKKELMEFYYYSGSEPFTVIYDRRDLLTLAAEGDCQRLKREYFTTLD